ncbi:MAG: hypothetical protein QNI97_16700 [Desulfobacterales bacterium]|nr:hypothetical protein [Desulfobacterales bacterium]
MDNYKAAKQDKRVVSRFTADSNFLGIGVGPKEVDGKPQPDLALKFFVRTKKAKKDLTTKELLPKKVSELPTDVVKLAPLRARGSFVQRLRPALGGSSGCVVVPGLNYTGTLGLGMRGYGGLADRTFVLSNNHVLANENRANIGDPVIQPGSLDGGDPTNDRIGELFDFVHLQFATFGQPNPPVNKVDAACAEITRFGDFSREIFWVGYPRGWRTRANVEDLVSQGSTQVQKTGRTTGYTTGHIAAVAFDGWVGYDSGDAYFEDQILIQPGSFSAPGDSGSCILDMDENIIGLLFAGGATHTIGNYIEDVWQLLSPIDFSDGRLT